MTSIDKRVTPGLSTLTLSRDSIREHFVTITPDKDESPESLFRRTAETIGRLNAEIVSVEVLGMSAADRESVQVLTGAPNGEELPLAWVENSRTDNLCGVHIWAISGAPVEPIYFNGRRVGTVFEDDHIRYGRLVGLLPVDACAERADQTRSIFAQMDVLLQNSGMHFSDVLRTWFYNDEILDWYGPFNTVRTRFFEERKVFEGLLPASTGVGGRNMPGAALLSGLVAIRTDHPDVKAFEVSSPLQSPAPEYGSSFSRAVELQSPDLRRLYVSGTASIDGHGETVFLDDPAGQVDMTMKVVAALLDSREMDWGDITRSLVYFKRAADAPLFRKYCSENGVPPFPAVILENDICRDDLLFEIEVDAVATA